MRAWYALIPLVLAAGCGDPEPAAVVVYTSVDQHYAEPVLAAFERETGIRVRAVYDVEASKTTGLVNRLIAERARPKADVFWNGEFAQTMLLKERGLLASYASPGREAAPWRDPDGYWSAFGGRARVLLLNREQLRGRERPRALRDLLDPRWPAARVALALPLFGTSATHAAALWAQLGAAEASALFRALAARGVHFLDGNAAVRDRIADGSLWFGLTDSDDACAAAARGAPVDIVFPDQGPGEMGTLVIPNTVALVAGGPHPGTARRLVDYLLAPQASALLGRLGWFHLDGTQVNRATGCPLPATIQVLPADLAAVHAQLGASRSLLRELLLR